VARHATRAIRLRNPANLSLNHATCQGGCESMGVMRCTCRHAPPLAEHRSGSHRAPAWRLKSPSDAKLRTLLSTSHARVRPPSQPHAPRDSSYPSGRGKRPAEHRVDGSRCQVLTVFQRRQCAAQTSRCAYEASGARCHWAGEAMLRARTLIRGGWADAECRAVLPDGRPQRDSVRGAHLQDVPSDQACHG
jgi:hypothetical protein